MMFLDAAGTDINVYTDSITSYISKGTEDIVPKINVRSFPNQKPGINAEVRAKLRAWAAAYNSGDPASYKKARYDLQKTIKLAKRSYRDRVESNYLGSDLRYELNARFEATNTSPAEKFIVDEESSALAISLSGVVLSAQRGSPLGWREQINCA
ncbi:hypothetical protein MHYP_G00275910 [Metynnis hypsauchen]